jgi:hypothetical protein
MLSGSPREQRTGARLLLMACAGGQVTAANLGRSWSLFSELRQT